MVAALGSENYQFENIIVISSRVNLVCFCIPLLLFTYQEISKDVEDHRLQYHSIHDFGDELLRHPKAGDTSFVTAVLSNLDQNWTSLEDVMAKR